MLPPEVTREIIIHLADNAPPRVIASYTLVGRLFRDVCQSILFQDVSLDLRNGSERIAQLSALVRRNTRLSLRIRRLFIYFMDPQSVDNDTATPFLKSLHRNATTHEPRPSLSVFSINFMTSNTSPTVRWSCLSSTLRAALEGVILSPTLSRLSVHNITYPLHLLPFLPSLRATTVFAHNPLVPNTNLDEIAHLASSIDPAFLAHLDAGRPARINELTVDVKYAKESRAATHVTPNNSLVDWSYVELLTFNMPDGGPTPIEAVLQILSQTSNLSQLYFSTIETNVSDIFSTMHPSTFDNLTFLEAYIFVYSDQDDPFLGFLDALTYFPTNNALAELVLGPVISSGFAENWELRERKWTRVVDVVTRAAFPSLKKLHVGAHVFDSGQLEGAGRPLLDDLERIPYGVLTDRFAIFEYTLDYVWEPEPEDWPFVNQ